MAVMLSLLVFIGEAVRDAFDRARPSLSGRAMSLVEVNDLSVNFKVEGGTSRRCAHLVPDREGRDRGAGARAARAAGTARSSLQLLPYPKAWHPSGIRLDGQLIGRRADA